MQSIESLKSNLQAPFYKEDFIKKVQDQKFPFLDTATALRVEAASTWIIKNKKKIQLTPGKYAT
jgi:hypothetical protein